MLKKIPFLLKKEKYYPEAFPDTLCTRIRIRFLHPVWFIIFIITIFILMFWFIKEWISEIREEFTLF